MAATSTKEAWQEYFTHEQVMRGLRLSIIASVMGNMYFNIALGAVFTAFALYIGASYGQIGLLMGALPLAGVSQLLAGYLMERTGRRQELFSVGLILGRMLWLPILVVPVFVQDTWTRVATVFVLLLFSHVLMAGGHNAWMSWMGDLIPSKERGRFLGTRQMVCSFFGMIAALLAGRFVGHHNDLVSFAIVYGVAIGFGVADVVMFHIVTPHPPVKASHQRSHLLAIIRRVLARAEFRQLIKVFLLWNAAVGLTIPLITAYLLKELKVPLATVVLFGCLSTVTHIIFSRVWGHLIPRIGSKSVLSLSLCAAAAAPTMYLFCGPGHYWPAAFAYILGGMGWSGVFLNYMHLTMELTPQRSRSMYMAVIAAGVGLVSASVFWLAGQIADLTQGYSITLGNWSVGNFQLIFLASAALRLLVLIPVRKLPDIEEAPVPVLRLFSAFNPARAFVAKYRLLARRNNNKRFNRSGTPLVKPKDCGDSESSPSNAEPAHTSRK